MKRLQIGVYCLIVIAACALYLLVVNADIRDGTQGAAKAIETRQAQELGHDLEVIQAARPAQRAKHFLGGTWAFGRSGGRILSMNIELGAYSRRGGKPFMLQRKVLLLLLVTLPLVAAVCTLILQRHARRAAHERQVYLRQQADKEFAKHNFGPPE